MDTDKINKLNEIKDWFWGEKMGKKSLRITFDKWYELLIEYTKINQKIPSTDIKFKEMNIGKWCKTQRFLYNKNNLDQEKINKLEQISGWYWNKKDKIVVVKGKKIINSKFILTNK